MNAILTRIHQFNGSLPLFLVCLFGAVGTLFPSAFAFAATTKLPTTTISASIGIAQKQMDARLIIPKIHVDAAIKKMGLTTDGAMAVPDNRVDVGWYSLGTRPGNTGSAVIGGHNRWNQGTGVFIHLDQLAKGDIFFVVHENGTITSFIVRDMRSFNPTDDSASVFLSKDGVHLNLITCSGTWDQVTQSYTKRLVIFTDALPAPLVNDLSKPLASIQYPIGKNYEPLRIRLRRLIPHTDTRHQIQM